jgi:hypothetical protein
LRRIKFVSEIGYSYKNSLNLLDMELNDRHMSVEELQSGPEQKPEVSDYEEDQQNDPNG